MTRRDRVSLLLLRLLFSGVLGACAGFPQSLSGEWVALDSGPPARSHHAAAWDGSRRELVLFGGSAPEAPGGTDETWVWDGQRWRRHVPPASPPARSGAAMAFDFRRGYIVLFGGWNSAQSRLFGDTWIWDGSNWSQRFPARSPAPRASHKMVWDAARGEIVLFGGWGTGLFNDTWVWDGSTWTAREPISGIPLAHSDHAMTFDEARQEVVAFGGCCGGSGRLGHRNTTWVWDGRSWTERRPLNPPPARAAHAMAYDPVNRVVVTFGGQASDGSLLNDTWLWDGTDWTPLRTANSPPPCGYPAMTFDPIASRLLLTGCGSERPNWALSLRPASAAQPEISAEGIASAASYSAGEVAPGEVVTIFGKNLGPSEIVSLQTDPSGRVAAELAGTQVLFDGIAAPLIYVRHDQLSAVTPFRLSGRTSTEVKVIRGTAESNVVQIPVVEARPGLFTRDASGKGQAAALNEDGSLNSADKPAAPGSVIVLYATGGGSINPPLEDGTVVSAETLPRPILPVAVRIGGQPAEVLYAGAAPNLVAGILQINARVPPTARSGPAVPVQLQVGTFTSPAGVTIAVGAPVVPLRLVDFRIEPAVVTGGQRTKGLITLNRPVLPNESFTVELTRESSAIVIDGDFYRGPDAAAIQVPSGSASREFTIFTCGVLSTQRVPIRVPAANLTRTLTIAEGDAAFSLSKTSVVGGESLTARVRLSGPAGCGLPSAIPALLSLQSSHYVVRVPSTLSIPPGQTTTEFSVGTHAVNATVPATIRISASGRGERSAALIVLPSGGGDISLRDRLFEIAGTFSIGSSRTGLHIIAIADATDSTGYKYLITISNGADFLRYPQFMAQYSCIVRVTGPTATFAGNLTPALNPGIYTPDGLRLYAVNSVTLIIEFTRLATGAPVTGKITFVTTGGTFEGAFTGNITAID